MKINLFVVCLLTTLTAFGQGEEVGPLTGNPLLQSRAEVIQAKANPGTFDSTFIYTQDTISLPIFDEFSTNKFQTYNANYTDPGVTFDKVYRVLDASDTPIPTGVFYTEQQTFKRTRIISTSEFRDTIFDAISLKIGDLSSYPVNHITTDVYPPYHIYDTINALGDIDPNPDTIWVAGPEVFQDSATQFFATIADPNKIWIESQACHNYTLAHNPWTLGVVSFDGLDEKGFPYAIGTAISGLGDQLTSKPIDMSGLDASDSVYFSFLYQSMGWGDQPESNDSLVLQFYAKDLLQWQNVWSKTGEALSDFKVGHIRLDDPEYFKKGFQFRFLGYGGLSGSLDHFHVDYVNLRTLSGHQDTLFKDYAFVYPVNTLINDYTSVPWDHWKNNFSGKMSNNVEMVVRNGSNISENNQNGTSQVLYNSTPEGAFTLIGQALSGGNINYGPRTTYESFHDFSTGYHYDETKTGASQTFDIVTTASAQFPNFTGNDSTFSKQVFENYYSYDDGSAEKAYGPTGVQARLAIQYTPYEADSLIGVNIHWVPSVEDVSNKLFKLVVWGDNGGQPGAVIYEDEVGLYRQPKYEFDKNLFTTYYFKDTMKVHVDGTFYVGWRQLDPERLNVGLDMNIPNNDKTFYSIDGGSTWPSSIFEGSVMIRPIFSTEMDATLGIPTNEVVEPQAKLYPNPTNSMVNIEFENGLYDGVEVYNLQGVLVKKSDEQSVDLSDQPNGVYLFRVNGVNRIFKVVKY